MVKKLYRPAEILLFGGVWRLLMLQKKAREAEGEAAPYKKF